MNELGLVSDLCEKSNKGEIMNCFIGQLEVSYIMFKSFLLKPTENNFPLRVKMCKEHMRTEKHISWGLFSGVWSCCLPPALPALMASKRLASLPVFFVSFYYVVVVVFSLLGCYMF